MKYSSIIKWPQKQEIPNTIHVMKHQITGNTKYDICKYDDGCDWVGNTNDINKDPIKCPFLTELSQFSTKFT